MRRPGRVCPTLTFVALAFTAACGPSIHGSAARSRITAPSEISTPAAISAVSSRPAAPVPVPAPDPVLTLIADSDRHFRAGQREVEQGHLEAAKQEFNRAVDLLMESPYGARTEPRIREYFDRLVDRVSAYEMKALAEGDGFTEKSYDTASIDDLLAISTTFGTPRPTAELQDAVKLDLESGKHDLSIPLNQRVLSYIELFQGRLHEFIEDGMRRGSQYLPMIQNVFRAEGLPLDLAYVPLVESAFKPNAVSRAKAKGVWQFMSGTAAENGLRRDWYVDERSDPEKATVAAAKYLKSLGSLFGGDWHLALASYNGGPGRLQRAMRRSGVEDFWRLADKKKILPRETREYVPMILAAIVIARNPAQYGFDFEPDKAPAFDTVSLNRPVDLRRIAEWAGTTIDVIQALNPELRRWTTPVRDQEYELKVPSGTGDDVKARLAEAPPAELASLKFYTVKRGESLATIARKLHVNSTDLAQANYLTIKTHVAPGEKLMVPYEATALMAARAERPVPVAEARNIASGPAQLAHPAYAGDRVKVLYKVQQGDTLSSIARAFKTNVSAIRTWNPDLPGTRIVPGERLTIFTSRRAN